MTLYHVKSLQIVDAWSLIMIPLCEWVPQSNFDCVKGSATIFWAQRVLHVYKG